MYSAAGGFVGTLYKNGGLGNNVVYSGTLTGPNFSITQAGTVGITGGAGIAFGPSLSRIKSTVDGNILLQNAAATAFSLLQFGGTTSSFAAIQSNISSLAIRLADNSAYAPLIVSEIATTGAATTAAAGSIKFGSTTATTVGAAGAAAAIPTPVGYIIINVAGTQMKIPYCNT